MFFLQLAVESREHRYGWQPRLRVYPLFFLCPSSTLSQAGQLGLIAARARLVHFLLTAGRAKKEMANTEKQDAIVFPIHVCGTLSPYPIVVTVTFVKKHEGEDETSGISRVLTMLSAKNTHCSQRRF